MPFARLYYHIVWGTKNRDPLIESGFEASLYNVLAAKVSELGGKLYAVGGIEDHIHVAATIPPRIAVSDFIGQLKGNSSHFINHDFKLSYHFGWQAEYGVVTFGARNLNMVKNYIHNQRQHHADHSALGYLEAVEDIDG
jgi:putative transposase